ncbi:MAG TPA: L-threonylcarbamoyladenylate synthase [Thermoanaerobaculia bacterium]|nr:L-threonylcarbamoyladenylate synthase [Thermoanaerobaculia bacterium]
MQRWTFNTVPTSLQLAEIEKALRHGGVVLLPTDTIYGLHALATDQSAADRVAAIKGREDTKPFVVLGASVEQLEEIGIDIRPEVRNALRSLWPAPLTAILPLRRPVPASRGASTLAVRIPALDWLRSLVERTGPLLSTSANRSGEPPVDSPENLARELQNSLDGLADGGLCHAEPSTILDFTSDPPRLIREGSQLFSQKVWKTLRKSL